MEKYNRVKGKLPRTHDRKLKSMMRRTEDQFRMAAEEAAGTEALLMERSGYLEPETEMEQTYKVRQDEIVAGVDEATRAKRFTLKLDQLGPYKCDYSRSGNYLLLGGKKGHLASFNWKEGSLNCELQVNETVHDVSYLQNDHEFFAAAQQKHTYIYDGTTGAEVHKLKHFIGMTHLEFLPYHYLLVGAGSSGYIKYQDVSTGQLVAELRTKLGPTSALTQNPWNAVIHAGHNNGTVTLWAPSMTTPLVKLQSSRGPVRALAVDRSGNYMAVAGQDRSLKIWDVRQFKVVESYYSPTPASSLSISATGLVGVGWGPHIQIWKDVLKKSGPKVSAPYMNHLIASQQIESIKFCPFEDVLGVGFSGGFDSMLVPGAGEANIDSLEANPYIYASRTGRREAQVRSLLEKLQPDMISLDPNHIGEVDKRSSAERLNAAQQEARSNELAAAEAAKLNPRTNVRGKNSGIRKLLRKKTQNVVDERKLRLERALEQEKKLRAKNHRKMHGLAEEKKTGAALQRFQKSR